MTTVLKLTVTTPLQIILQEDAVVSIRAEDAGILASCRDTRIS